jgi:hypothetical protein
MPCGSRQCSTLVQPTGTKINMPSRKSFYSSFPSAGSLVGAIFLGGRENMGGGEAIGKSIPVDPNFWFQRDAPFRSISRS